MKQVRGIWLPDYETDIIRFLENGPTFAGAGTYQLRKLLSALPYVSDFGHAVDVGAHIGTWSRVLARCFTKLTAFEPIDAMADCFELNVAVGNWHSHGYNCDVALHRVALSNEPGELRMDSGNSTMLSRINEESGNVTVDCRRLDGFQLGKIDFIKIDVEGFEQFVLIGGEQTIKDSKPVIIIEQKPDQAEHYSLQQFSARKLLKEWGAVQKWEMNGDVCMVWK